MASRNEGSSHPQDPRRALEEFARRATRYSVNLNGCVSRNEDLLLRGSAAVVRSGTIDFTKMADKVGTRDASNIDGWKVAIKSPCAGPPNSESNIKKFLKEVHVWSRLDHANVHPLLGITTEFELTVSIVPPWMRNGNAHDYVQNQAVDPRPLIEGIAEGLHYLHNHEPYPIFHGDLKGANVLISDDGKALLTDFGFSAAVNSSFSMAMSRAFGDQGHCEMDVS
ncbi:hypothetical protein SCLCIDRAFT_32129 [Scleroderma citrinum Foug A]|uniref:Protein kinase domain-containing protein n=1 Tax=Scleroderma citrinum Foug A TaxID=1036808 RepID=A0A0C3DAN2_9AGAM|nr:hypothetical protein SCLCIDRAFT_32129 [Scleroderma citrinum Foug A]